MPLSRSPGCFWVALAVAQAVVISAGGLHSEHRDVVGGRQHVAASMAGVKLLYNNDGENLWAVTSPYHAGGSRITTETIQGSVRDVAGVADVDLICPFHNVPWWNSNLEPPEAHRDWYDRTFNFSWGNGGSQLDYVLRGGDFVGQFAAESLRTGQTPFVTIRLNDGQMCQHPPRPDNDSSLINNDHQFDRLSEFWWNHKGNSSLILGLQQEPPEGFRPCCWDKSHPCTCSNAACEFSWVYPAARDRIVALIGELASMYAGQGVGGISLDFQRGLDYFPPSTPAADREEIMHEFISGVRQAIDAARPADTSVALGLRLTPTWSTLRAQGIGNLSRLADDGVTYLNWGTYFWARQPFDSELASLAAATPTNLPFYVETSSWVGQGPLAAGCPYRPKIRVTQEELWTTALLAGHYGAAGLSVFNFVYTRPFYDHECAFEINKPYSEPLFSALALTKNDTFLRCCADQFYRLSPTYDPVHGQMGGSGRLIVPGVPLELRVVAVSPQGGWRQAGRLRLLLQDALPEPACLRVSVNGSVLPVSANKSSLYGEGAQATLASFSESLWMAWDVPNPDRLFATGNNTISVELLSSNCSDQRSSTPGEHTPVPPTVPRGPVNNTNLASSAYNHTYRVFANKTAGALACQAACDSDPRCAAWTYVTGRKGSSPAPGVERCCYHGSRGCPEAQAGMWSGSRVVGPCTATASATVVKLELSLPVVPHPV